MGKRIALLVVVLAAIVAGVWYLADGRNAITNSNQLKILTTFEPMYIFTKNVVGDVADVQSILPQGTEPHDYAFTPADVQKIAKADVIIKQGKGVDDWLDGAISAAGKSNLTIITASVGVEPHTGPPIFNPEDGPVREPSSIAPLEKPTADDPHTWLDPYLAIAEVENIRDGLIQIDPRHRDEYAHNAEVYLLKLLTLDGEIRKEFANIKNRSFIAFHPAFRYFAYEYGLREIGAIEETRGRDPSPAELVALVKKAIAQGTRVVFTEPGFSPKIVESIVKDYNLIMVPIDTVETGEFRADYYEETMRTNAVRIAEALKK